MTWPSEVPVVEPMCCWKGGLSSPNGKHHCSLGWLVEMFGYCTQEEFRAAKVLREIAGIRPGDPIDAWNDDQKRRKVEIARVINRTTAVIGYTEGNPEAAFARRWWRQHGKPPEAEM